MTVLRIVASLVLAATTLPAQHTPPTRLAALLRDAEGGSPVLRAARARWSAARSRIEPSGTRPDPMLQAGILNLPITRPNLRDDEMTMSMIGISQSFPAAGRLAQRRRVSESAAESAAADYADARLMLRQQVESLFYELMYADRALPLVEAHRDALSGIVRATEARYTAGSAPQHELLNARIAAQRTAESALMLREQRRAAESQLNAALDRDDRTPIEPSADETGAIVAAMAQLPTAYADSALGSRLAGSPLLPTDSLHALASARSPMLASHEALIRAQQARLLLAQSAGKPDVDVTLQYGNRLGRRDMITAMVAIPLHVQRTHNLDPERVAAQSELDALMAEHDVQQAQLRADITGFAGDAERSRSQAALYGQNILPQARAAVSAALSSYQSGRTELATVLAAQTAVLTYETILLRAQIDFTIAITRLRQAVGTEVLR